MDEKDNNIFIDENGEKFIIIQLYIPKYVEHYYIDSNNPLNCKVEVEKVENYETMNRVIMFRVNENNETLSRKND